MRNNVLLRRLSALGSVVIAASLLSGCGKFGTDHIEVGAIPDDYRTRHPIVIAETQKQLSVPVGSAPREMSYAEKEVIYGFLAGYGPQGSGAVQILVPSGHAAAGAASYAANQIVSVAHEAGHGGRTIVGTYPAPPEVPTPPVVVMYGAITASAGPCGKWPEDAAATSDNKQYHNFGCAIQNNLAAQVANPMDLLHPRRMGPIDAADRDKVIGDYRNNSGSWGPNIDY
jgi:pilus assembly protein CpaD